MKFNFNSCKLLILLAFLGIRFTAIASDKFALVRMIVSEKGDVEVNIIETKIIDGAFKEIDEPFIKMNEGDLLFQIANEKQVIIKELVMSNPLHVRLEYPNDDNTIGSKEFTILEKEIIIRFNFSPDMKNLIVSRININGTPEIIKSAPLKPD